ncbi:MAG: DUF1015 family protein [Trebonia sp.]
MQTHFPSGDGSDAGVGLLLTPFRAVRYDLSRVGGLANVTSPPYDVIGPGTLERLLAASPYNVVRLILPAADTRAADIRGAGAVAAARLRDWLAEGVLAVDGSPALYVYEQRAADWVQRGLIGLVEVGTGAVHPHEGVMPGPVAGRRELMKATRGNLEPILLVYNGGTVAGDPAGPGNNDGTGAGGHGGPAGPGEASRLTDRTAEGSTPLARAVTDDGITHRLWAVTDPGAQAAIAADLATRTALIADGHHRYAAYQGLRSEMRDAGAGAGPWDYGLAFLVDADEYPLHLGAIHRVIPRLPLADAAGLAAGGFTVTELAGRGPASPEKVAAGEVAADVPGDVAGALRELAEAGRQGPAFLLAGRDGFRLLTRPDRDKLAAAMPSGTSDRWRALDASVMQELLLARLWSIKDNERDVLISHNAAEAVRMAWDSGGTAVICNPMPLAAVMDIAAHGEKVPRKSTSFGPKPRTGLVLRTFDAGKGDSGSGASAAGHKAGS